MATQILTRQREDFSCDTVTRQLNVVLPRLEEMSLDQVASICQSYGQTLQNTVLDIRLFGSFQKAGWHNLLPYPSVRALSQGYAQRQPTRNAEFWFYTGGKMDRRSGRLIRIDDEGRYVNERSVDW